MKYILLAIMALSLTCSIVEAGQIRDFSMPEDQSLQQQTSGASTMRSGNYGQYMRNTTSGSGYRNNGNVLPSSGLPNPTDPTTLAPVHRFMDGYCDPNFKPIIASTGKTAGLSACLESEKQQACDRFNRLPADAQRVLDDAIACGFDSNENADEEYYNRRRDYADCSMYDSRRLQLLKKYTDDQETSYALMNLPDMVLGSSNKCMQGR